MPHLLADVGDWSTSGQEQGSERVGQVMISAALQFSCLQAAVKMPVSEVHAVHVTTVLVAENHLREFRCIVPQAGSNHAALVRRKPSLKTVLAKFLKRFKLSGSMGARRSPGAIVCCELYVLFSATTNRSKPCCSARRSKLPVAHIAQLRQSLSGPLALTRRCGPLPEHIIKQYLQAASSSSILR